MDKGGRGRDKGRMVFDEGSIKPAPTTSRASADERIHPPYKIATLVAAAAQEGLPAATLLDGTGLDAAALNDAEVKTSSRQFALACRNALAAGASPALPFRMGQAMRCLLYTSDAADERSSVDLGGRRIIKQKTHNIIGGDVVK